MAKREFAYGGPCTRIMTIAKPKRVCARNRIHQPGQLFRPIAANGFPLLMLNQFPKEKTMPSSKPRSHRRDKCFPWLWFEALRETVYSRRAAPDLNGTSMGAAAPRVRFDGQEPPSVNINPVPITVGTLRYGRCHRGYLNGYGGWVTCSASPQTLSRQNWIGRRRARGRGIETLMLQIENVGRARARDA